MSNENLLRQLSNELFDVVKKYSDQMPAAELIGALELHKQELIFNHFSQVKKEMFDEKRIGISN
jgi:hypothetical protein